MTTRNAMPIPITIITGFLGAGKTTLLNRLLRAEHGLRLAVLVNDFGAVNIDAQLIVGIEGETISLKNGRICCTIRDDLREAVLGLLARGDAHDAPDAIVIETSGVSDPYAVATTFTHSPELRERTQVDCIVVLVDAEQVLFHVCLHQLYERGVAGSTDGVPAAESGYIN